MQKSEFQAGEHWAYRSGQRLGTPAARVELVALPPRKGHTKVKVRYVEGDLAGLEEFVHMTHLRCRWKDWKKVEQDEAKEAAFLDYMADQPEFEKVVAQAASAVLLSSGEDLMVDDYRDFTRVYGSQVSGLERVADRAGLAERPWRNWPCFRNRTGDIYMPNQLLLDVAMAFAQAEPEAVHLYLDNEEQEKLGRGYASGEHFWHKWVIEQKPAWALARAWATKEGARDHLKDELGRLQQLVREAVRALRAAGDDRTAGRLERALGGK